MTFELQNLIFNSNLTRRILLDYKSKVKNTPKYKVQVFRNHSFELIEHTIPMYLDYAGMNVEFNYSGYDDSFSFLELDPLSDMIIVWVDTDRYKNRNAEELLLDRIKQLKLKYLRPVLVIPLGMKFTFELVGVTIFNVDEIKDKYRIKLIDERTLKATGTRLSNSAMLLVSRILGLKYLPSLLQPLLKCIVLDLDNTLYKGVLGEDGIQGVKLTDGHKYLQKRLKELSESGFFLSIASKNEICDVKKLFYERKDFILNFDDFAYVCASWEAKADMIAKTAAFLNIGIDSLLFVDDNIGELSSVKMAFPNIRQILALDDAMITAKVLNEYPGLFKLNISNEDLKRKDDVKANELRKDLQHQMSKEEYIKSLKLKLDFCCNKRKHLQRVSELANKTNQFIFNYKRYSLAEVERYLQEKEYTVVTISLADKLSDSGLIGVCVGHLINGYVEIEECFISCRALGRGIDDVIVLGAIKIILDNYNVDLVKVAFKRGERNKPAKEFVDKYLQKYLEKPEVFKYIFPDNLINVSIN